MSIVLVWVMWVMGVMREGWLTPSPSCVMLLTTPQEPANHMQPSTPQPAHMRLGWARALVTPSSSVHAFRS